MEGRKLEPADYRVTWKGGERVTKILYRPFGPDMEFAEWLSNHDLVAMDIETTGFDIGSSDFRVRTIQVGDKNTAWVFPEDCALLGRVAELVAMPGRTIVTHNGVFDWVSIGVSTTYSKVMNPDIADTYILARHWDPRGRGDGPGAVGHSMEALVRVWISEEDAEDLKGSVAKAAKELGLTKGEYFANVPIDDETYIKYAGMDCAFTMELHDQLTYAIRQTAMHDPWLIANDYKDMQDAIDMGVRGMSVDVEYLISLKKDLENQESACKELAKGKFGVTSLASSKQLYEAFLEAGVPVDAFERTAKGAPQVNAKKLKQLADEGYELAKIVIEGKRAQKWRKAYVDMIMQCSKGSGRIHPQINIFGARTGRYSVSNPPLQQLPSGTDMIRRAFIADPGCVIVSVDYSGQELRLCAALSGDANLIADFTAGINPMKKLAATVFGDGYSPDEYKRTKICVYAMLYGGGVRTIANQTGLPEEQVKAIKSAWYSLYPGAKLHSDQLMADANMKGYITGITGRLLVLDPGHGYAASNAEFQNGGRELISKAIREIPEEWKHTVRLQVHDELVFVVPTEVLEAFTTMITGVMETSINGIHFPVEVEVCGQSWAGHYS